MLMLPDHLLLETFSYLLYSSRTLPRKVAGLELFELPTVCRKFNALLRQPTHLWEALIVVQYLSEKQWLGRLGTGMALQS